KKICRWFSAFLGCVIIYYEFHHNKEDLKFVYSYIDIFFYPH
ncbi:MAG: hypothetical protein ACI914_000836, partial [Candidatus Marivariicella framensis]